MVFGVLTRVMRKAGSHTPLGNFSSKRGNKNFYKGKGGKKYGKPDKWARFQLKAFPNFYVPDMTGFQLKPYVIPTKYQNVPTKYQNVESAKPPPNPVVEGVQRGVQRFSRFLFGPPSQQNSEPRQSRK